MSQKSINLHNIPACSNFFEMSSKLSIFTILISVFQIIDTSGCFPENNCDKNAICITAESSYYCQCNAGYEGSGYICTDENECVATHQCSLYAACVNTDGSYECICRNGYIGDGFSCHKSFDDITN
ncbi:uncharacterized protein LOC120348170 [Styela clava]